MNPLDVVRKNVWNYKQNKPSLVAKDFARLYNIPEEDTLKILTARGVCKWLSVRRQLIRLKNEWKTDIKFCHEDLKVWKDKIVPDLPAHEERVYQYNYGYVRGKLEAFTKCRNEVRELCHSERWQAPDYDKQTKIFLEGGE